MGKEKNLININKYYLKVNIWMEKDGKEKEKLIIGKENYYLSLNI